MSDSQTELKSTEIQQHSGTATQQQLKWRKGKSTPAASSSSTTPQSNSNDIGKSSCIDVTITPTTRLTTIEALTKENEGKQPEKQHYRQGLHQSGHPADLQKSQTSTQQTTSFKTTSQSCNDFKLRHLASAIAEETHSPTSFSTPTEMLPVNTHIHILPSPETARIRPTNDLSNTPHLTHSQPSSSSLPSNVRNNSRSSMFSFFWPTSSRLDNNPKSNNTIKSVHPHHSNSFNSRPAKDSDQSSSLSPSHQHHQFNHQLNLQADSGSTGATNSDHQQRGVMITTGVPTPFLGVPKSTTGLALDASTNDSTQDDDGNTSFDTSRQNSRTSVASNATCATSSSVDQWSEVPQPSFSFDGRVHHGRRDGRRTRQDSFDVDCSGGARGNQISPDYDQPTAATARVVGSEISESPSQQSAISTDATPSETGGTATDRHTQPHPDHLQIHHVTSTLCQCPCRNCATCPLRGISQSRGNKKESRRNKDGSGRKHRGGIDGTDKMMKGEDFDDDQCDHQSATLWGRIKTGVINFCMMEAEDDPSRFKYDVRVIPKHPLPKPKQRLLEITELPFLILWVYFTYWAVIVAMTAAYSPATVWLSATVASVLVGIGLNANAYKSVTVPRRRGTIRHHRHARALLELRRYGESIDTVEMKLDWGMVIRFFIIPFGVSSLAGLTNANRDEFLLVFPQDPYYLMIAILCPAVVVTSLAIWRVLLLWRLKVRWSLQVLFLNGALVD